VGVDVGGTSPIFVALAQDGTIEVRKVVTTPTIHRRPVSPRWTR